MTLVSLIVPVYNVEIYLPRCVDSILAQTFKDFELILVDDGSPDNSGTLCDNYAKKDNRVHVIHKLNGGLSDARNAGINWVFENSNSNWISFVDSDDWIHPQYVEALVNAANNQNTDISVCAHQHATSYDVSVLLKNLTVESIGLSPEKLYLDRFVYANIACAKLYRKELFNNIRYPEKKLHEDMFVTYRLLFMCKSIAVIDKKLYYYFDNSEGITKSEWTPNRLDAFEAWEKQIAFFSDLKDDALVKQTAGRLIRGCGIHYRAILKSRKLSEKERRYYIKHIRKILRKYISNYKECLSDFMYPDYYYEIAYPNLTKVDKAIVNIKTKVKRVLNHVKE